MGLLVVGMVVTGPATALAQVPEGGALTWGGNFWGELGHETDSGDPQYLPDAMPLPEGVTVTDVAAGYSHNLALTDTGEVYSWGNNDFGQLGDGTNSSRSSPELVPFPVGTTVTQIAAGALHSLALTSTGAVYAWGANWSGGLGDGTTTDSATPVAADVPVGDTVTAVAGGFLHSLALTSDGDVLSWGSNATGQLGDGTTIDRLVPVEVHLPVGVDAIDVAGGAEHSLAVTSTGTALGWGGNQYGAVGDGTTVERDTPVEVDLPDGVTVTDVVTGATHSLALTSTGTALGWGNNFHGQVGDGTFTDRHLPVEVDLPTGTTLTTLGGEAEHSVAVTSTGDALSWGLNYWGQLGDGTFDFGGRATPVDVVLPEGTTVTEIDGSHTNTVAVAGPPTA
ncbi:MAG: RCC1 domain-containing protein [Actinopolymorphaceae bacterium]